MRILLLAQFFPPDIGGEERHVLNLANALSQRGHQVAVATQRTPGDPDTEVLPSGVRVYRFGTSAMHLPGVYTTKRHHHPPVPDPLGVRALARIVRQECPDVVHAHNWIVNSALALRRNSSSGPRFGLVLTLHDFSHVCATKRMMRAGSLCDGPGVSRCLPCAATHYGPVVGLVTATATAVMRRWKERALDHVVSVSTAVARANSIPEGPASSVIPNFVPDSLILDTPDDKSSVTENDVLSVMPDYSYILFVGDLSGEKGVPILLRAYESLGEQRPPLLLVGKRTPDTPEHLPAGATLHLDWPHEHVVSAFRHCLFAVLPSVWPDPCPTTILEAMASGRPVISSPVGGIVDMIDDERNGLLVPPSDDHQLAAAMKRLLSDEVLRAKLGSAGKVRVRDFTASSIVSRLEAVYTRVAPLGRSSGMTGDIHKPEGIMNRK